MAQVGCVIGTASVRAVNSDFPVQLRRANIHSLIEGPRGIAPRHGSGGVSSPAGEGQTLFGFIAGVYNRLKKPIPEDLAVLETPPTMKALQPLVDAYMAKVREMQAIVAANVRADFRFNITENWQITKGQSFKSGIDSASELPKWGSNLNFMEADLLEYGAGHLWATVEEAHFKSSSSASAPVTLQRLKVLQEGLKPLYAAITAFVKRVEVYEKAVDSVWIFTMNDKNATQIQHAEDESAKTLSEHVEAELLPIRKGVVSAGFIASLLYRLELSLERGDHPGD